MGIRMSEKRVRLTEIVSKMGRDATPAQVREEARRVGFGTVDANMLFVVRDALWPDRKKQKRMDRAQWSLLTEKRCTACKRILPVDAFTLTWGSNVIRRSWCKECSADNRATYFGCDLVKRYGITFDEYHSMLNRQSGRCAICGTDSPYGPNDSGPRKHKRRTFSVDHCHATGTIRGLLCNSCNLAIGNFDDDVDRLRTAVAYITAEPAKQE